jgi:hypothetical protein
MRALELTQILGHHGPCEFQVFTSAEMDAFQEKIYKGVMTYANHETRVENHGLDAAIQQLYMLHVFPSMSCSGCAYDRQKLIRIPNQILQNWLH